MNNVRLKTLREIETLVRDIQKTHATKRASASSTMEHGYHGIALAILADVIDELAKLQEPSAKTANPLAEAWDQGYEAAGNAAGDCCGCNVYNYTDEYPNPYRLSGSD